MSHDTLYKVFDEIHSFVAFIFLLAAIISVGYAIVGIVTKRAFSSTQYRLAQLAFITSHIQLLLGIIIWYLKGFLEFMKTHPEIVMKNPDVRLLAVEHPTANIIGIILLSIGYIMMKKQPRGIIKRHYYILVFYGIALLLIMSRIPWNLWLKG